MKTLLNAFLGRSRLLTGVGLGIALAGLGSLAWAAIPGGDGVIRGCYEKKTGALRVIDAEARGRCKAMEGVLQWNQSGPQGLAGSAGPPGPAGKTMAYEGATGTATIFPATPPSAGEVSVAHIDNVPPGRYAFSATLRLTNVNATVSPDVVCTMIQTDPIGRRSLGQAKAHLGTGPGEVQQTTLAMQSLDSLRATTTLSIDCGEYGQGTVTVSDASIIALQVTDVVRNAN